MTVVAPPPTVTTQPRHRRRMRGSRRVFVLITLGVPFAFYALFVLWPFVQAFIYSLTNWSGFSPYF
jgi:N-acetylglucosamine transport system permease protein